MLDLTGRVFGRWTVIRFHEIRKQSTYWYCDCSCGVRGRSVKGSALHLGRSKSCGCARKETLHKIKYVHGATGTLTYKSWLGMISRCYCKGSDQFKWYGARGISVCRRWRGKNGYLNFVADMGERPSKKHSIDRVDVNRGYSRPNCRWLLSKYQQGNRRNTVFVIWQGERLPLKALCASLGVSYNRSWYRIVRFGWPIERAITAPNHAGM